VPVPTAQAQTRSPDRPYPAAPAAPTERPTVRRRPGYGSARRELGCRPGSWQALDCSAPRSLRSSPGHPGGDPDRAAMLTRCRLA